jgi:hypothetical protein
VFNVHADRHKINHAVLQSLPAARP